MSKDKPTNKWEEEFDKIKSSFLAYNAQSGSRFLVEGVIKEFISNLIAKERQEEREYVLGEIFLNNDSTNSCSCNKSHCDNAIQMGYTLAKEMIDKQKKKLKKTYER